MPRVIEIVIRGSDLSGPAFASAATNLARLTQGSGTTATGLARVETQAHETGSAIITLGIAGSTTQTRMRSLTVSILNQEDALQLAERRLREVRAAHDADSLAVGRAELAYNRLNRSLENNRARMRDLRTSGDVSGISVAGVGGAAAGPGGLMGEIGGAASTLGLAFGAREAFQAAVGAGSAANDLEHTTVAIRALAGSTERYNEVLALARRNQSLFGGTTQANLESFRALIPVSNALNIELRDLDQTRRLLAAYQPESAGEAGRSIREFLTGTGAEASQSLQMIFELDKRRLDAIVARTDDPVERSRLLREELARIGVTERLLTDQTNTVAISYDRLGASADRAKTAVGGLLARGFQPYAEGLSGLLQIASGDVSGGVEGLYRGGNMALGYRGAGLQQRMSAVGYGENAAPVIQNITVQGSLVTERELAETTRRLNTQTAARNGVQPRR